MSQSSPPTDPDDSLPLIEANEINRIDIHAFGDHITNADKRVHPETGDPITLEEVLRIALKQLDQIVDLSTIDLITTGIDEEITHALDAALESEVDDQVEFEVFMMKAKNFLDDDDVDSWNEAWAKMARRRNEILTTDNNGRPGTDLMVRITDGGRAGETYMRQGISGQVPVLNLTVSHCIDWSKVDFN